MENEKMSMLLTNEEIKFINSLNNEVHRDIGKWAMELIQEKNMSIKEVKEAMQRMIDIAQRD